MKSGVRRKNGKTVKKAKRQKHGRKKSKDTVKTATREKRRKWADDESEQMVIRRRC